MALKKCEKSTGSNYTLEISVSKEEFAKEIEKVYKKNVQKMNIPGFRKGKAPKSIVEKMYGNNIFWDDAINNLYPMAYKQAVEEAGIEIVGTEKIDVVSVDIDNGFVFKVECVSSPDVEISEYKNLNVTKNIKTVTDEEINNEIDRIRNSYARTIDINDRPAQIGDDVIIDFEGKIDGVAFDGGKAANYTLKLGSNQFIPGFEEQIVGHKIGEEFDIAVPFPKDYHSKELAGKGSIFTVTLHEIKQVEVPELDDEFVKDVSEFDTVTDFKNDVKNAIQKYKDNESEKEVEEKLIDSIISNMKVELPKVMVEERIEELKRDFETKLQKQNIKLDDYLQYAKQSIDEFKKMFEPEAIRNVKLRLALKKIAELENFEITKEELDKTIKDMAEVYKRSVEEIGQLFDEKIIQNNIKLEKAINLIKETAKIKEINESKK